MGQIFIEAKDVPAILHHFTDYKHLYLVYKDGDKETVIRGGLYL